MAQLADGSSDVLLWEVKYNDICINLIGKYSALSCDSVKKKVAFADHDGNVFLFDSDKELDINSPCLKNSFNGIVKAMVFHKHRDILLLTGVRTSGTIFSVWDFLRNKKRDVFFVYSMPRCPSTRFSLIRVSEENKVLLVTGNSFVLGVLCFFDKNIKS